jgi:CelD/BcsL family acetyltransferase involved in cellulose biosynthesis
MSPDPIVLEEPTTLSEELTCHMAQSFDDVGVSPEDWDQAVLALGGPIYMSYDWLRTWAEFYCKPGQLRLFIFRSPGRIVGLLPIYIDSLGWPPFRFRVAKVVGASIPPKVFDPPISTLCAEPIWRQVIAHLIQKEGCDLISFGPISEGYAPAEALRQAASHSAATVARCDAIQRDVRTVYTIPSSFDDYFNSLDSKERKIRRKKLRDLTEAWPVRAEIVKAPEATQSEFEAFVQQHTAQWQGECRPGHFHAWPDALEYNRALVKTMARLHRVRFFKLLAGEHVVANQYTFAFGKTLFAELPARINGAEWNRFSLGCTSQIKLIEAAIDEGYDRMDSGLGHYDYKILTGGQESRVDLIHLVAARLGSRLKVMAYRQLGSLLQLLVQKAWYRRISPKLPLRFRGGMPRFLLRFDF